MEKEEFRNSFSRNTFYNKYAQGPDDTWHNLAIRLVDDVCGASGGKLHPILSKEERDFLTKAISEFKFIPGGRYLYYAGRPAKFYNNCLGGETKVLSDQGLVTLREHGGQTINLMSPVDGKFYPAKIINHGKQVLNKITFAPVRGNSNITYTVRATRTHHWPLQDGTDTYDLRVGDKVPANAHSLMDWDGFVHGFVYGDGNANGQLRLCANKDRKWLDLLSDYGTVTYPASANGDPVLYFGKHKQWKELPVNESPEYIAGFIRGWIQADGSEIIGNKLCCVNKEAVEWFRDNAAYAGIVISGALRNQVRDVAVGDYSYRAHNIYIQNYAYGDSWDGFKVVSIEPDTEEDVFCPYEPIHNRFILEHNIDTFNCYLLRAEEDTREEWGALAHRATSALMSGGGIGVDYSILRPSGHALSRTGGRSSGPLPLMYMINEIGRNVMQGGSRRSAIYASLNWQHEDAPDFLVAKNWSDMQIKEDGYSIWDAKQFNFNYPAPLDMTNISLNYDDAWLKDPLNNTFIENVRQALSTGEPGFSFNFGDKENETLRNACVPGDTPILTDNGYVNIEDVVGTDINVWNGEEWSGVKPFSTGTNPLVEVELSDGSSLECTSYHEFVLSGGERVEAKDLNIGDKLEKFDMPVVENGEEYDVDAYSQGFYSGDGNTGLKHSWLYWTKFQCEDRLVGQIKEEVNSGRKTWIHGPMFDKGWVPVNGSLDYCLNWFAGLIDADGTVTKDKNGNGIQIASIDHDFLESVRLMLTRMGVRAKIVGGNPEGMREMPDGKGGLKEYQCQETKRLLVGNMDTYRLMSNGLKTERVNLHAEPPQRDARRFVSVVSVTPLDGEVETFCFTDHKAHRGTFNGIVTGQCTEVTSEDDSDVCNLGSINIGAIETLEEFKQIVQVASKFLVCGTVRADLPYDKVREVREKNRRLGLGLMGIHEWLLKRGAEYEVTPELHKWLQVYQDESEKAANEHCDRLYLSKPAAYRSIAPTGTIGILAGTTTGIEPLFAVAYKRRYLTDGTKWKYEYVVDSTAEQLINEYGVDPEKIDTALSLSKDPERRIKFQADIQDYVDMAISSTINLPKWGSKDNNESHVQGFAETLAKYAPRLRGFTCYPDGARGGQPLTQISYEEAMKHKGVIFEEHEEVCKGGVCGI